METLPALLQATANEQVPASMFLSILTGLEVCKEWGFPNFFSILYMKQLLTNWEVVT
jgi:hypothetical protein